MKTKFVNFFIVFFEFHPRWCFLFYFCIVIDVFHPHPDALLLSVYIRFWRDSFRMIIVAWACNQAYCARSVLWYSYSIPSTYFISLLLLCSFEAQTHTPLTDFSSLFLFVLDLDAPRATSDNMRCKKNKTRRQENLSFIFICLWIRNWDV